MSPLLLPPRLYPGRPCRRFHRSWPLMLLLAVLLALAVTPDAFAARMAAPDVPEGAVAPAARGPAATSISISPAVETIAGCEVVTVEVLVEDIADLYGAHVQVEFNPAMLQVVDADLVAPGVQVEPGGFLAGTLFTAANKADNTLGTIDYAATQENPTLPASGSGAIIRFQLAGRAAGTSDLEFALVQLSDRDGEEMLAAATSGGSVTVTPPTAPTDLDIDILPDLTTARLSWPASPDAIALYRDPAPYFTPVPPPYTTAPPPAVYFDDLDAIGNPLNNHYYVARTECGTGLASALSQRVGEFDYFLEAGTP